MKKEELIKVVKDDVERKLFAREFKFQVDVFGKPRGPRQKQIKCDVCGKYYKPSYKKAHIETKEHKNKLYQDDTAEIETAYEGRLKTYSIKNVNNYIDPLTFLNDIRSVVIDKIKEQLNLMDLKVNVKLFTEYQNGDPDKLKCAYMDKSFKTKNEIILKTTDLAENYDNTISELLREMDEFEGKVSGWVFSKIYNRIRNQ
jgi:hypothetical protein